MVKSLIMAKNMRHQKFMRALMKNMISSNSGLIVIAASFRALGHSKTASFRQNGFGPLQKQVSVRPPKAN